MASLGVVSQIWRFPVKSMLGETLDAIDVVAGGATGDRAFALIDDETGKVVSVKRPKRWLRIFELAAMTGNDGVRVVFPDGETLPIDDAALPARLSAFLGRSVSVSSSPAADATFDESWVRDLKDDAAPYFGVASRNEGDDTDLIDAGNFMGPNGNFFNFGAVHLVTTGTTRRLRELAPESRFDAYRFRPNFVIETDDEGFVETGWQGQTLEIGTATLQVSFTVPRCVMTTLAQGELPADLGVLRAITEQNSIDCFGTGVAYPCVGVYADVTVAGVVNLGDEVRMT